MRNIMIGTAGHVDHGKTRLIKALTGMDTDRLAEEKKRGITIENGFADMYLDGYNVSIIDVPGHEKFVGNMLAGIGGVDIALFVIGLDEGVMPQTVEHFRILKALDIKRGITVFTKDDLVPDEEWKQLVEEDAFSLVKGSFLESAPSIRVSSETGFNIARLKDLIRNMIKSVGERETKPERFRLPVDRVFTVDGFGTVATGTLIEGRVSIDDEVSLYPADRKVRIRNLQVHGQNVETAYAGERTAVNLAGLKKDEIKRGDVLAFPGSLTPSRMIDAEIEIFGDSKREVANNGRIHFYCGSGETVCRASLMDRDRLRSGEKGFVRLRCEGDIAVKKGDRFIIRFYSPPVSIGGGIVLDADPKKRRRGSPEALDSMKIKASGDLSALVGLTVKELGGDNVNITKLENKLRINKETLKAILEKLVRDKTVIELLPGAYVHESFMAAAREAATGILAAYHREDPLSPGMKKEELKSRLGLKSGAGQPRTAEAVVAALEKAGEIEIKNNMVKLAGFNVTYSDEAAGVRERVLALYKEKGFEMPKTGDVISSEKNQKLCKQVIDSLTAEGALVRITPAYCIDKEKYALARKIVTEHIRKEGNITLGKFRDRIGASRKYAVIILEHFDEEKLTVKTGDARVLA